MIMCDGYPYFAEAFVTDEIDDRGYVIVRNAVENAPETAFTARTASTKGRTRGKRRLGRLEAFLSVFWPVRG